MRNNLYNKNMVRIFIASQIDLNINELSGRFFYKYPRVKIWKQF